MSYARSLDEFTATGAVWDNGPVNLSSVMVLTDGTNDATVVLHDNASAGSGVKIFEANLPGTEDAKLFSFERPVRAKNGLYLTLTGTGASCIPYIV